jgi:hypothetical protein
MKLGVIKLLGSVYFGMIAFLFVDLFGCQPEKNNKDSKIDIGDEEYDHIPTPKKYLVDTSTQSSPEFKSSTIPKEMLNNIVVKVKYIKKNSAEICELEQGSFLLKKTNDGTTYSGINLLGILDSGPDWVKYCSVDFLVPWDLDNPPSLPLKWEYLGEYASDGSMAVRESYFGTGLSIYKVIQNEEVEYDEEVIYPRPPGVDPHNVEIEGQTVYREGTSISFEEVEIKAQSCIKVKDHAGMQIEVSYFDQ